ncbi:hypothetical protein ACFQ0B_23180 [Nonomuraea thailandensis]
MGGCCGSNVSDRLGCAALPESPLLRKKIPATTINASTTSAARPPNTQGSGLLCLGGGP